MEHVGKERTNKDALTNTLEKSFKTVKIKVETKAKGHQSRPPGTQHLSNVLWRPRNCKKQSGQSISGHPVVNFLEKVLFFLTF